MFKKTALVLAASAALVACGGTKTVYVTSTEPPDTEAPETTVKVVKTTDAPLATAPMWSEEDEFVADIRRNYYGTIYVTESDMVEAGRAVCTALLAGASGQEVAFAVVGAGGDTVFISTVVAAAVANFCPSQAYKFG